MTTFAATLITESDMYWITRLDGIKDGIPGLIATILICLVAVSTSSVYP